MVIQTEVTLQPDYVLSACEREKSQCIAEIVILSPAQRTPMVKSSTVILVVLIFCPPCGAIRRHGSLTHSDFNFRNQNVPEGAIFFFWNQYSNIVRKKLSN